MKFLSRILSNIALKTIDKQLHKQQDGDGKTVHLPMLMLIIGVGCTGIVLIPTIISFCEKEIVMGIIFSVFALLCSTMILGYCNQRICYDEDGFTSKTFLGVKRRFSYADIEYIRGDMASDIKLKVRNKTVHIDEIAIGKTEFLAFAQKQYRLLNGGKNIPICDKKSKCDAIFNGNVKNPTGLIVVYVIITVLFGSFIVAMPIINVPTPMDELEFKTVIVDNYSTDEECLSLNVNGFETDPYLDGYKETLSDVSGFLKLLDNKEKIKIGYVEIVDDGVTEYKIKYVEDVNGLVYATPEDFHEYYQENIVKAIVVFALFFAVWIANVALSIYVGRNPRKFSKKFVRLFFKDGTIKM